MGVTKHHLFTEEQNQLATWSKALGHPARIAILQNLLNAPRCINGDLVSNTGLSQPTISQHLRELKEAGILEGSIEGTKIHYCIHAENWSKIGAQLGAFIQKVPKTTCC